MRGGAGQLEERVKDFRIDECALRRIHEDMVACDNLSRGGGRIMTIELLLEDKSLSK